MKRKNLMILLLIAVIGIVGVTIAYFSSRATFENVFETPEYGTEYIEKFTSPDNWKPGDVTEKTLEVRNSGSVDEAVRVKVEESWISQNGTTLPLKQGDNVAADIHWINEDDWTKVTVDGEDYYYYYYNYKLAPQETTSKLLDKVTFNPLINATTSCSDTVENGLTTRTCNSSGAGYDGATYTLKFTIETVQYNKYKEAWNAEFAIAEEKPHPATQYLAENATNPSTITSYNDASADKGKMFYFTHTLNEGTENEKTITETRYIGNEPKNYVYFNCDDTVDGEEYDYATSCEVWRIIGVFDVERTVEDPENAGQNITITETRMKLVRGTSLGTTRMWDNRNSEIYSSGNYGKNDWNRSLMQSFLTVDYYNGTGEASNDGLKSSAREQIDGAKYYLGGVSRDSSATAIYGTTEKIYGEERGTTVYNSTRPTNWEGKVALMYPSDMYMTYAKGVNTTCYNNPSTCDSGTPTASWIYKSNVLEGRSTVDVIWFLSPLAGSPSSEYAAISNGKLGIYSGYIKSGVRPVVYLKSDVQIFDGDGSKGNPYKLK